MHPKFFCFDHHIPGPGVSCPWAYSVSILSAEKEDRCKSCGRKIISYEGEGYAELDEQGTFWTDVIGSGCGARAIFSERAIRAFEKNGIDGFEIQPVRIVRVKSRKLRKIPPPRYYYMSRIYGRMDVDFELSEFDKSEVMNLRHAKTCRECGRWQDPEPPNREHRDEKRCLPREDTWDGTNIFLSGNVLVGDLGGVKVSYSTGSHFCTYKVLQVAREHRLTNFRFLPMDAIHNHALGWLGIKYLGKQWPPKKWYPDPPSAGKTVEEWIELYMHSGDYKAWNALRDLVADAVPLLCRYVREGTTKERRRAGDFIARAVSLKEATVPREIMDLIHEETKKMLEELFSKYNDDEIFAILLNDWVNGGNVYMRKLAAERIMALKDGRFAKHAKAIQACKCNIESALKEDL